MRGYRVALHVLLIVLALIWLFPLLYALLASLRDYSYTAAHGYVSWGGFTLKNYLHAWDQAQFGQKFINSAIITIPAVLPTMPLVRPALAALTTLEVTWIYNEYFWATVLLQSGSKYPITSSLNNLKGEFFTDNNLVSAGSMIVAVPTIIIYFVLQKQFVSGLTLGATKG